MKKMVKKKELRTSSEAVFDICNSAFLIIIMLICFFPIYYTIIASFSDPNSVIRGEVTFWIRGFTLESYKEVFKYKSVLSGYRNTIIYTALGTIYALFLLIPASYALSKKHLVGRKLLIGFFMFTVYFGGGMIPSYLLLKDMNMLNNPIVLFVPGAFGVYNMLITRTFFESNFSESLAEAARIDGAGEMRIFMQIALPLSGAIVSVMALYIGVGLWNSYFSALLYIQDAKYYPLQLIMYQILNSTSFTSMDMKDLLGPEQKEAIIRHQRTAMTMRYSLVILANIPVFVAYPFVQKYFVKGVMIGAVKG